MILKSVRLSKALLAEAISLVITRPLPAALLKSDAEVAKFWAACGFDGLSYNQLMDLTSSDLCTATVCKGGFFFCHARTRRNIMSDADGPVGWQYISSGNRC